MKLITATTALLAMASAHGRLLRGAGGYDGEERRVLFFQPVLSSASNRVQAALRMFSHGRRLGGEGDDRGEECLLWTAPGLDQVFSESWAASAVPGARVTEGQQHAWREHVSPEATPEELVDRGFAVPCDVEYGSEGGGEGSEDNGEDEEDEEEYDYEEYDYDGDNDGDENNGDDNDGDNDDGDGDDYDDGDYSDDNDDNDGDDNEEYDGDENDDYD